MAPLLLCWYPELGVPGVRSLAGLETHVRSYSLGARGQRSTNVRPEVSFTFDEIVALFDPNVVSYWKFQSIVATISPDEKGIANATVTGSPELNIPTIVKRDTISDGALTDGTCIAWQRVSGEYAQAAHNAAHKTASGTIVVYFQRDTSTIEKSQLVEADVCRPGGRHGYRCQYQWCSRCLYPWCRWSGDPSYHHWWIWRCNDRPCLYVDF